MTTTRTKVSKSNPAIKAIIKATLPEWTGRTLSVVTVGDEWHMTQYIDDRWTVKRVDLVDMSVTDCERPQFNGGLTTSAVHRALSRTALVIHYRSHKDVEIIVLADELDHDAIAVAVDAALEGDTRRVADLAGQSGVLGGIAAAIATSRATDLAKRQRGVVPTALNLWVLRRIADGRTRFPNAIEATSAEHMRRCMKAGLVRVMGKELELTEDGIAAIASTEAA